MDAIVGTNVRVQVQSTLGADKAVTAIAVTTAGVGMVQLDGQAVRIENVTTNTFDLEDLDMSDFDDWIAAAGNVVNKVTAFQTYQAAQNITMPNPAPTKLDKTTLLDKVK